MKTVYSKDREGHQMKTVIPMPDVVTESQRMSGDKGEPQLHITTHRGSRGILTSASMMLKGDCSLSHVFPSDYMRHMQLTNARATESAIRAAHDTVLAGVDNIVAQCRAFYAAKA